MRQMAAQIPLRKGLPRELNFARAGINSHNLEVWKFVQLWSRTIRIQLKWMNYIKEEHNSTDGVNSSYANLPFCHRNTWQALVSLQCLFQIQSGILCSPDKRKKKKKPVKKLIHPNHIYKMHNLHTHRIYLRVWREGMSIMLVNKVIISKTREENLLVKC